MRYVIVSVVKENAGDFNNNLRKEIFNKFGIKSSKLPAHFTIKSPFEANNIDDLEILLDNFSKSYVSTPYKLRGYDRFDNRVIYMKVIMSTLAKNVHNNLIEDLSSLPYINFDSHNGKDKVFHITVCSKKITNVFDELLQYISKIPCNFECNFDNICIYKWHNNTWKLHKEFELKKDTSLI
ncbi:MAG: 2'-5' RNA ligase family protein [Peptostreptococcaceae bacterium]